MDTFFRSLAEVDAPIFASERICSRISTALGFRECSQDDFDADTQFCLHWVGQHGWETGKFGEADTLARANGTAVSGVQQSGVIDCGARDGRLLKWKESPANWDPATDARLPI